MPMLGVLIALLLAFALIGCIRPLVVNALGVTDQAASIGIAGLVGLGSTGTLIFFGGMINVQAAIIGTSILVVLLGPAFWIRYRKGLSLAFSRPQGLDLLFPLAIGLALLMALAGVLAPSTSADWDSLAYHLAVPKMWLEAGKIEVIPTIHQSNFPFAVDSLFLLGLKWGGQAGAKAFVWIYTLLGAMTIFGLARQRYGQRAGWWACLVFTTVPAVLWLSGTAYIDVAHGLYAGLGLIFACWWLESNDSKHAWLSAIMLGFALGTKYTGLQTLAVAGLIALVGAILMKRNLKPVFLIGLVALAIGGPWYVKNAIWKSNPVFPFFYSKLGGKDWDQRRAEIYTNEQNTFGVGREAPPAGPIQPQRLGHSVLGLAYQPGRYVNPMQTVGGGDPMGAIGIAVLGALMLGMFAGQRGKFERALLAGVLISLGIWFVLTQQSRYILTLTTPLALIAGQLTTRRGFGALMGGISVVQALLSLYLLNTQRFSDQMQVIVGKVSAEEYQARRIPFYLPAQELNKLGKDSKIALYDEVFGYLLDVPYVWANPGHSTTIPYDTMQTGKDFVEGMRKLGFSNLYLNLQAKSPQDAQAILQAMGGQGFPEGERERMFNNWEIKYNVLIPEAVVSGDLEIVQMFGRQESPRSLLLKLK